MAKRNRDYSVPRHTNDSKIAQARMKKGWTQQQLADALGILQIQVSAWEGGRRTPKVKSLMRIGDALGVDWTTLIEE